MALLRAERMHEQSYAHAVNALLKVRKQAAAARVPMVERELVETWSVERGSWVVDRGGETRGPGGRSDVVVSAPAPRVLTPES